MTTPTSRDAVIAAAKRVANELPMHDGQYALIEALAAADLLRLPPSQERVEEIARETILHIATVAEAVGWQAGVGASETAGMIISCLAKRPELVGRFLTEGVGLLVDGEISPEHGCLTFHRIDGAVTTPSELRIARTAKKIQNKALSSTGRDG